LRRSRRGIVLLIVLSMVAAVSAFLVSIFYLSSSNFKKTESLRDYTISYHAAVSAVKIALKFLREDNNGYDGVGDDWAKPISYNYSGIFVSINISDECGKLNVNRITNKRYYNVAKRLFQNLGVNGELLDCLKDWIDKDSTPSLYGAESYYYESLGYKPSNAPLKSLGEIYYVKGFSESVVKKLKKYLTVYGSGKINVNSAPKELLMSLSDRMTEEIADSIIEARPIKKLEDLKEIAGMDKELYYEILPLITNRCDFFEIDVTSSYGDSTSVVRAFTSRGKILEWKVVE
jgi:general secretion pathway protein K